MVKRHYAMADVQVDVTDDVEMLAEERAKELVRTPNFALGIGTLDLDAATLGVLRLRKRGTATPLTINRLLLDLLGSDALRREVRAAMRKE